MSFQKCFKSTPFEIYQVYHVVMHIKSLFATPLQEQIVVESLQECSSYYWLWLFFQLKKILCMSAYMFVYAPHACSV